MTSILDLNLFDSVIGNASSSKILRMFTIHEKLTVKELIDLTHISESQIHVLLRNLVEIKLLEKISRGLYGFSDLPYSNSIKEAYLSIVLEYINNSIYKIQELVKRDKKDDAFDIFDEILLIYAPLIKKHFSRILASLSHEFL